MEDKNIVLQRAKNAVISRDFDLAIRLYNGILREEPDNEKILSALGNIYVKTGKDEKALAFFEKILEKYPMDFDALNNVGGIYRRLKIYDEAIVVLNKALSIGKNKSVLNYNLGFTYKSMGKYEEATECFQSVIDENPQDVLAYNHLGAIYADQGDFTKAISTYKKGLQIDPNHPVLQYNLAKAYESLHDDGNAVTAYETALRAKPGWFDAVRDYGNLLINHRRTKAAGDIVRNAIELHPENSELHTMQGNIFLQQCNLDAAIESLEKSDQLSPENPKTLEILANAYERKGKKQEAVEAILEAEKNWDQKDKLHIQKQAIGVFLSAGKVDEALQYLKKTSTPENKQDPGLINLAGQFYILTKKEESVQVCNEQLKKLNPSYDYHLADWAARYNQIGNTEKSRELFLKYLDNHNKDTVVWVALAQLDEKLGNDEVAQDEYSTALAFDPSNFTAKSGIKRIEQKVREKTESVEVGSSEFDLGNYVIEMDSLEEKPSDAESKTDSEMEEVDIFEFDDTVTKGDVEAAAEEADKSIKELETSPQMDDEEESVEETVDDMNLVSDEENTIDEMLDFFDDDKSFEQSLVPEDEVKAVPEIETVQDSEIVPEFVASPETEIEPEVQVVSETVRATEPQTVPESNVAPKAVEVPVQKIELAKEAEQVLNAVEKANDAAERAWNAAQSAADVAQSVDSAEEYLHQIAEDVAEEAVNKAAVEATERLNKIADELQDQLDEIKSAKAEKANQEEYEIPEEIDEEIFAADQTELPAADNEYKGFDEGPNSLDLSELDNILEFVSTDPSTDEVYGNEEISEEIDLSGVPENLPDEVAAGNNEDLLNEVSSILPRIASMLENKEDAEKFKKEVTLFQQLRSMGDFLPDQKKQEFLIGKTRLLLDFLIARLSGRPGLLKTVDSLRETGVLDGVISEGECENLSIQEMTEKVLEEMKNLAKMLPDETMGIALIKLAQEAGEE